MYSTISHQKSQNESCRVCGFNKNTGRNFGVITCSTCKAFFRRNGRTASGVPVCRFGGHCLVNERTRRQCPACRLDKCFAVGMQKDLIRTDEERAARLQLVRANRLQKHSYLHNKSIHSVTHERNKVFAQRLATPVHELSANDWIRLTSIRNSYEHICLYPMLRSEEEREGYLITQPVKYRLKEYPFISTLNVRLASLVKFFHTAVPEFSLKMNSNDRRWLIRTNLHYLLIFSSMDLMNINGNKLHFSANNACYTAYLYVYGQELLARAESLIRKLNYFIGSDPTISKVMQIILFLSPCLVTSYLPSIHTYEPPLETIIHLFRSQQQYVQTLWLYLLHRCGETNAQKLLMCIVGQVLQQQNYGYELDKGVNERQAFGNMVYKIFTSFSIE